MHSTAEITINNSVKLQVPIGTLLYNALSLHCFKKNNTQYSLHQFEHINTHCGGNKTCKKCRVNICGNVSSITPQEREALTLEDIENNIRLACFCKVMGDCNVTLKKQVESVIKTDGILPDFDKNPMFKQYGIAIDIGTTTLAAHLYSTEVLIATTSAQNPQVAYGADVITRIGFCLESEQNAITMSQIIITAINELIADMCQAADISFDLVDSIVITGNSAMLYLLTKRNAKSLSCAPFKADCLFDEIISAKELNIICKNAQVYLPPCISAFIGADITTAILASNMCNTNKSAILCDIGTNGEIALWHNGKLTCCSTAAGPACEGAGIQMGMRGKQGAIDHVSVANGKLNCSVIGNVAPVGICGSGVIDTIACLLQLDIIDETGYMQESEHTILSPVVITQKDVRMIQLAKSAICAGIDTTIITANLNYDDIETFYIAGGFGSYLNINSAANIGLIPKQLKQKAKVMGNSALMGACMLLLCKSLQSNVKKIANLATTIHLEANTTFIQKYTDGMFF